MPKYCKLCMKEFPFGYQSWSCTHCGGDCDYGEKKHCPTCNEIRQTTCVACGCGSCTTCGHRFSCGPPIDLSKTIQFRGDFIPTVWKFPDTLDTVFNRIKEVGQHDANKTEFELLAFLTEEVGEVSRALSEEKGLKYTESSEGVKSECSDVINNVLRLYVKLGGTKEELIENCLKKVDRWEKRIGDKSS